MVLDAGDQDGHAACYSAKCNHVGEEQPTSCPGLHHPSDTGQHSLYAGWAQNLTAIMMERSSSPDCSALESQVLQFDHQAKCYLSHPLEGDHQSAQAVLGFHKWCKLLQELDLELLGLPCLRDARFMPSFIMPSDAETM